MRNRVLDWGAACVLAVFAGACSDQNIVEPPTAAELVVVARPPVADTVEARPTQGIVVELRNDAGQPVTGAVIRFTGLPAEGQEFEASMLVGGEGSPGLGAFVADTTTSRGRAVAIVRFGFRAGLGRVAIESPEFGLADTLAFTIQAGAPNGVIINPRDTTVYPNAAVQLRGRVVDRFGNPRTDPVTFSVSSLPLGIATVTTAGVVTATAPGRLLVRGVAGGSRDSVGVSVMPPGTLAAVDFSLPGGKPIVVFGLDGSGRRWTGPIGAGDIYQTEPEWSPTGAEIAFTQTNSGAPRVAFVGFDDVVSTLFENPPPDIGAHYWPTFSPDGQYIYFSGGSQPIWRARRNGTGAEPLTEGLTQGFDYRPSASPDGKFLAFYSVGPLGVVLRVFDLTTRALTPMVVQGRFPAWSPLGDKIAFIDNDGREIKTMNPDGSNIRIVSQAGRSYGDGQISWSPDGKWIAAKSQLIDVIEVASRATLPISGTENLAHPSWKPRP